MRWRRPRTAHVPIGHIVDLAYSSYAVNMTSPAGGLAPVVYTMARLRRWA